jgi:hypothetical protein
LPEKELAFILIILDQYGDYPWPEEKIKPVLELKAA